MSAQSRERRISGSILSLYLLVGGKERSPAAGQNSEADEFRLRAEAGRGFARDSELGCAGHEPKRWRVLTIASSDGGPSHSPPEELAEVEL